VSSWAPCSSVTSHYSVLCAAGSLLGSGTIAVYQVAVRSGANVDNQEGRLNNAKEQRHHVHNTSTCTYPESGLSSTCRPTTFP
jgi:hypothetical protein